METEVGGQEGEGCMMRLGSWVGPPDPRKPRAEHPPGTGDGVFREWGLGCLLSS